MRLARAGFMALTLAAALAGCTMTALPSNYYENAQIQVYYSRLVGPHPGHCSSPPPEADYECMGIFLAATNTWDAPLTLHGDLWEVYADGKPLQIEEVRATVSTWPDHQSASGDLVLDPGERLEPYIYSWYAPDAEPMLLVKGFYGSPWPALGFEVGGRA